jgi:hypothetical protein
MCELCFPDAAEIGIITEGYSLILDKGKYSILGGQGHRGHEIYTFSDKPFLDPDPECDHNVGPIAEEAERWLSLLEKTEKDIKLDPYEGYCLVSQCMQDYNPREEYFIAWLLNKCGKLIAEFEVRE